MCLMMVYFLNVIAAFSGGTRTINVLLKFKILVTEMFKKILIK